MTSDLIIKYLVFMECRLRHIARYPFLLGKDENVVGLTYTCLVDSDTADKLKIESHGFRFIRNNFNQELMLLVVRDDEIQSSEVDLVLHVPFQVLRQFSDPHPEVIVTRKIVKMQTALLPKLRYAEQVNLYFNTGFEADQSLVKALTHQSYLFRTGEIYLQLSWLKPYLSKLKHLKSKLQLRHLLSEHESGRYQNYFRCYIEVVGQIDPDEYLLFKNKTTKANIKTVALHPFNLYRSVNLDKVERQIYGLQPYSQLSEALRRMDRKSKIVLLEAEDEAGVPRFVHWSSQNAIGVNYYEIDCATLSSTAQFFSSFGWISNLQASIILIRNISWLEELYQAEQILSIELKHILAKIQKDFSDLCSKTMRSYTLILMHHGKSITQEMLQQSRSASIGLDKPMKAFIFKLILDHFEGQGREEVAEYVHDKVGWQKFKQFMQDQWENLKDKNNGEVVKAVSKLVRQEQAENLMEVSWDDVGGLETAKEEIMQTILLPIRHPEIFDEWIKPRTGLLFYGPPGTGKTLLGKCIAKQCKMSFISVKGPQLLNMYVGESEKNVRQVFQRAVASKPCIVFMDELDALIPKRGNSGDSNQVMDRIVAELLMQMDIASSNQVFVIGATNRPDLLDPSILRPGRFDKQIYLGITTDLKDRVKILKAQTRHLTLAEDIDWEQLLQKLPANLTGADFYGLTSKAVMAAAERVIEQYQLGAKCQKITISQIDFLVASEKVKPSVTEEDLRRYDQLRQIYS